MLVKTLHYGEVEVPEERMIRFESGIPGFKDLHAFAILEPDPESVFWLMHSLEDENISFLIVDPFAFYPDYAFELDELSKEELEIADAADVLMYCIVTIRESLEASTINLLAPVVVNMKTRKAKQIILHSSPYHSKHTLLFADQSASAAEERG